MAPSQAAAPDPLCLRGTPSRATNNPFGLGPLRLTAQTRLDSNGGGHHRAELGDSSWIHSRFVFASSGGREVPGIASALTMDHRCSPVAALIRVVQAPKVDCHMATQTASEKALSVSELCSRLLVGILRWHMPRRPPSSPPSPPSTTTTTATTTATATKSSMTTWYHKQSSSISSSISSSRSSSSRSSSRSSGGDSSRYDDPLGARLPNQWRRVQPTTASPRSMVY